MQKILTDNYKVNPFLLVRKLKLSSNQTDLKHLGDQSLLKDSSRWRAKTSLRSLAFLSTISLIAFSSSIASAHPSEGRDDWGQPLDKCIEDIYLLPDADNDGTIPTMPLGREGYVSYGWWDVEGGFAPHQGGGENKAQGSDGSGETHWWLRMFAKEGSTNCLEDIQLVVEGTGKTTPVLNQDYELRGYWDVDGGGGQGSDGSSGAGRMALYVKRPDPGVKRLSSTPVVRGLALYASEDSGPKVIGSTDQNVSRQEGAHNANDIAAMARAYDTVGWWDVDDGGSVGGFMGHVTRGSFMMTMLVNKAPLAVEEEPLVLVEGTPQGSWEIGASGSQVLTNELWSTITLGKVSSAQFARSLQNSLTNTVTAGVAFELGEEPFKATLSASTSVAQSFGQTVSSVNTKTLSESESNVNKCVGSVSRLNDFDVFATWQWTMRVPTNTGSIVTVKTCHIACTSDAEPPKFQPFSPADIQSCLRKKGDPPLTSEYSPYIAGQDPTITVSAIDHTNSPGITTGEAFDVGEDVIVTLGSGRNVANYEFEAEAGRYQVRIQYAAAQSRPVNISLNGASIAESALTGFTGGWGLADQEWTNLPSFVELADGSNTLRIERDGPFPHIRRIEFKPITLVE